MRKFVAERRAPRLDQRRDGERIGAGAGRDEGDRHVFPENLGQAPLGALRPIVRAIGWCCPVVGVDDGLKDCRRGAGGIVAGEVEVHAPLVARTRSFRQAGFGGLEPDRFLLSSSAVLPDLAALAATAQFPGPEAPVRLKDGLKSGNVARRR